MALGKTIQYTPFQETSFGYGSGELATNYSTQFPNATDFVKIIIEHTSGNWNNTGHISTPTSGTALAFYNKATNTWKVVGERDDVDVVLSQLKLFPADKPESRPYTDENTQGFKVTPIKENTTTGNYIDENPDPIGDTEFSIKLYDFTDTVISNEVLVFDPVEPSYGNQRPYWSVEPSLSQDVSSAVYENSGSTLNFGTISHGLDTDNVKVTCQFINYKTGRAVTDNTYGQFLNLDSVYVGDKTVEIPSTTEKFVFTGSVAEAQTFLDNVQYRKSSVNETTFQMYLTISDGIIGSEYTKTIWHDRLLQFSSISNQSFVEDTISKFDIDVDFLNLQEMPEVNSYKAVITLDSTGQSGASDFGTTTTVDTETFSNGVLTIIDSDITTFKHALRNLQFDPVADFNSDFTFTVQFTAENVTLGTTYTNSAQTVNVSGQAQSEATNLTITHYWNEDREKIIANYRVEIFARLLEVSSGNTINLSSTQLKEYIELIADGTYHVLGYYWAISGGGPIKIIHPVNESFEVIFEFIDSNGLPLNQMGDLTSETNVNDVNRYIDQNTMTLYGSRDILNGYLEDMRWRPYPDYSNDFTVNVTVNRTSGDLTFETPSTGILTFISIPEDEYEFTEQELIYWNEDDEFVNFSSGFLITDTSVDNEYSPTFNSDFKFTMYATLDNGTDISQGDLVFGVGSSYDNTIITGSGVRTDPLVIIGSKNELNTVMQDLVMKPKADYTASDNFSLHYKLERGDTTSDYYAILTNNIAKESTKFFKGFENPESQIKNSILKFGKERITDFSGQYKIVDAAKFKNYEVRLTLSSYTDGYLRVTDLNSSEVEWDATNKIMTITGDKDNINETLETLEFVPNFGYTSDFKIYYYQLQTTDNIVQESGSDYWDVVFDPNIPKYQSDSITRFYFEDEFNQDVFKLTDLKNLDAATEINVLFDNFPLHYETILRFNPTTEIYFSGGAAVQDDILESAIVESYPSSILFTGSRDECNSKIRSLTVDGYPDRNLSVDVEYSQYRWLNRNFNEVQANQVLGLSFDGTNVGEVDFTTQVQYVTNENALNENGVKPTSKYLQEYKKYYFTNYPETAYIRPINIIDNSQLGGETLYKLSVTGHNFPEGVEVTGFGYRNKTNFHKTIESGFNQFIKIPDDPLLIEHNSEYEVTYRVSRLLGDGTELDNLEERPIKFIFKDTPRVFLSEPVETPVDAYLLIDNQDLAKDDNKIYVNTRINYSKMYLKPDFKVQSNNFTINSNMVWTNWDKTDYDKEKSELPNKWFWRYNNGEGLDVKSSALTTIINGNDDINVKRTLLFTESSGTKYYTQEEKKKIGYPQNRWLPWFKDNSYYVEILRTYRDESGNATYEVMLEDTRDVIAGQTITPVGQAGTYSISQKYVDDFGLVGNIDITYVEKEIRISETIKIDFKDSKHALKASTNNSYATTHRFNNEIKDPSYHMWTHDSGDDLGAFTISSNNLLHQDNTDASNAVLCSHFWVSDEKIAFAQMGSNINPTYPELYNDLPNVQNRQPYRLNSDNTSKLDYKHQTDLKYVTPPNWNKIQRIGKQSVNGGLNLETAFTSAFTLKRGFVDINPDTTLTTDKRKFYNALSDSVAWFGSGDLNASQKVIPYSNLNDNSVTEYTTGIAVRDVPEKDINNFLDNNVKSETYDGTYAYKFVASGVYDELKLLGKEFVYNVKTGTQYTNEWTIDFMNEDEVMPNSYTLRYSDGYTSNQKDRPLNTSIARGGDWDWAFGEFEFYRSGNFLFYRPSSICVTRSSIFSQQGKPLLTNVCWILEPEKDQAYNNEYGNPASTKPVYKVSRVYEERKFIQTYSNESINKRATEYKKWARRTPTNNSGRIFAVRDGNGTYILPTGHVVSLTQKPDDRYVTTDIANENSVKSTPQTLNEYNINNLTRDISNFEIDYFYQLPNGDIVYIDGHRAIIDDGSGKYDIKLPYTTPSSYMTYFHLAPDRLNRSTVYLMKRSGVDADPRYIEANIIQLNF